MYKQIEIKNLMQLGLTERESKVYVALIDQGLVQPKQIPALVTIPRSKIYETLFRLQHLGLLAERQVDRKKYYEAVPPADAIDHLLSISQNEMEEAMAARRRAATVIEEQMKAKFQIGHGTANAQEFFTFLQNPSHIMRMFDDLQNGAERDIMLFSKAPYVDNRVLNKAEIAALRRGVRCRCLYEIDKSQDIEAWAMRHVQPYLLEGEEARICDVLPIKLAIFDYRICLMQFVDQERPEHRANLVINDKGIAEVVACSFEHYWERGTPIQDVLRPHL